MVAYFILGIDGCCRSVGTAEIKQSARARNGRKVIDVIVIESQPTTVYFSYVNFKCPSVKLLHH